MLKSVNLDMYLMFCILFDSQITFFNKLECYHVLSALLFFLLPLYSGDEMWEGIWNQTHMVILNFCLKRVHHVTISHDKTCSNRWCQWPVLFRTMYRMVSFCNWDVALQKLPGLIYVGPRHRVIHPMHFLYDRPTFL